MSILGCLASLVRRSSFLRRVALRCIPDVEFSRQVVPLGSFRLRLRRHRSYWLRHPLTHETFALGALRRLVRTGDVVFDIGANIGVYSRFLSICQAAGKVFAFEPMTENLDLLRKNTRDFSSEGRIEVMALALGETDGQEDLQVDDVMSGTATLSRISEGRASHGRAHYGWAPRTELVVCRRVDSLIAEGRVPSPHVLKIDVEGAEGEVLRGARDLLKTRGPRLLIELHGPARAREVVRELESHSYFCYGYLRITNGFSWQRISAQVCENLQDPYDLHFVVASKNIEDVEQPITAFPENMPLAY